jgi:putative membrane-bound dehydrogenase-like protein
MKKCCLNHVSTPLCGLIEVRCHELTRLSTLSFVCFLLGIACFANAEEKSLAELIPRIPPKSVAEALQSFKLQHGFSLELVAAEPDVVDPIDAAFDERGRMYVVEMNDYPFLPEQRVQKYRDQRSETWGRIRLLTDTDQDGRMDKSVIFADRLRWPQSVICYQGGVFVISPPNLYFMKDTDGDDVADLREIVCSGFNTTNVQALANGLEWGRDNAIYFSSGIAGGELTVAAHGNNPEFKFTPGRRDLRLDPSTRRLTMVAGGQQFGHTIDDFGERFVCSNSNHIIHATWPLNYLERNPLLVVPDMTRSIGKEGAAAVVFRASSAEPWRLVRTARRAADPEMRKKLPPNELVPIGFFTSATGITVYRGGAYPAEFRGNVFIGDCGGNLVHRKTLTANGISFVAERADRDVEFLTSTDNWFRPVNFVNAPDGTLYVLDMYRETIEHPFSIPDDIKALVDLESGYDKGRIWRLVPPNYRRTVPPNLDQASTEELVSSLGSPDGWVRETAQRLLVQRNDQAAVEPLRSLVKYGTGQSNATSSPQTQIHALWTLHGLHALRADDLQAALASPDEHVCEHALRLVPELAEQLTNLNALVTSLSQNPSARVRWQLAFTLGELPAKFAIPGLKELARRAADDSDLRTAWLSSCHSQMGGLASELLTGELEPVKPLLKDLAKLIGSAANPTDSIQLLESVVHHANSDATRIAILNELGEGLRRRGTTIVGIMGGNKMNQDVTESLMKLFQRTSTVALNKEARETDRIAAIRLLAQGDAEMAEATLPDLLTPQSSPALQQAAVKSLAAHGTTKAIGALIDSWKGCGPATRREIVDNLVQSSGGAKALLAAIENTSIKPGEIERDKRQLLMNHPQVGVREAAKAVLAEPPSNRKQVVADYQPALELTGDAARGRMLYGKTCIQCHRAGKEGHQVGPDFASVQNKSTADLLVAILDPNREAQPNFQTYTAITKQGKVHTGIISAETAASLTLKRAEAKEDVVLRETLDELVSNGVSLMPEGMEKDLNQQQLADLIAMIKSGQ